MRFLFGQSPSDIVITYNSSAQAVLASGAILEAWSAEEAGSQYPVYSSEADVAPIGVWKTDLQGRPINAFLDVPQAWISADGGPRFLMTASDGVAKLLGMITDLQAKIGQPGGIATLDTSGTLSGDQVPLSLLN